MRAHLPLHNKDMHFDISLDRMRELGSDICVSLIQEAFRQPLRFATVRLYPRVFETLTVSFESQSHLADFRDKVEDSHGCP